MNPFPEKWVKHWHSKDPSWLSHRAYSWQGPANVEFFTGRLVAAMKLNKQIHFNLVLIESHSGLVIGGRLLRWLTFRRNMLSLYLLLFLITSKPIKPLNVKIISKDYPTAQKRISLSLTLNKKHLSAYYVTLTCSILKI